MGSGSDTGPTSVAAPPCPDEHSEASDSAGLAAATSFVSDGAATAGDSGAVADAASGSGPGRGCNLVASLTPL